MQPYMTSMQQGNTPSGNAPPASSPSKPPHSILSMLQTDYARAATSTLTFKKMFQDDLEGREIVVSQYRDLMLKFKNPAMFDDGIVRAMMEMQLVERHIHDAERYGNLWRKLVAAMPEVTSEQVHHRFVQWFMYCHGNYLYVLSEELLVGWFHYLMVRGDVQLLAATLERLVRPNAQIIPKYLVLKNVGTQAQGSSEADSGEGAAETTAVGDAPADEPLPEMQAAENATSASPDSTTAIAQPPPMITLPAHSEELIRQRFLQPEFLAQVMHFFSHMPATKQSLGDRYVEKYFRQYCLNPNKHPFVPPKNNRLLLTVLRSIRRIYQDDEYFSFFKQVLPYLNGPTLTAVQIDKLANSLFKFLGEKAEDCATFNIHLYERYMTANPLILQNYKFLYAFVVAYAHVGSFDKAVELYGIAVTRSILGGLPQEGQPTNVLDQIENYATHNSNFRIPEDSSALIAKMSQMSGTNRNPDFYLYPNKNLFDKMINIYSRLRKYRMMRLIFEQYLTSKQRTFLDRKIVSRVLLGYIHCGRMKEAVAMYAQYCRGDRITTLSVPPSCTDVVRIVQGYIDQKDLARAFKFFEACMIATPHMLESMDIPNCKFLCVTLDMICQREPELAASARRYLYYFRKRVNDAEG